MNRVAKLNDSIAAVRKTLDAEDDQIPKSIQQRMKTKVSPLLDQLSGDGEGLEKLAGNPAKNLIGDSDSQAGKNRQTIRMLGAGFIVTSLLWASTLAALIDRRFLAAAAYLGVAAACSLTGIIHSPMPGSPLVNPFHLPENLPHTAYGQTPLYMGAAYLVMVAILIAWHKWRTANSDA